MQRKLSGKRRSGPTQLPDRQLLLIAACTYRRAEAPILQVAHGSDEERGALPIPDRCFSRATLQPWYIHNVPTAWLFRRRRVLLHDCSGDTARKPSLPRPLQRKTPPAIFL